MRGIKLDWDAFADGWRAGYKPAMQRVRTGALPWMNIDALHRLILDELLAKFAQGLPEFAGRKVVETDTMDGYKFMLGNGGWVMFRASGTEPVFRCYLEGRTRKELAAFRQAALELVR